ncbi:response regulator [Pseudocolwellia agarivorans]|jgi:CheY-like chemotaxis protein|uniref:response regulator n=1 Tax=Pseudocolwellia agarivorans TaxID=1911682 RepID=UPI003F8819D1
MANNKEVSILLIEDDDIDAKAVQRVVKKLKLTNPIIRATNGAEALEILRNKEVIAKPYIIFLDLNMPIMGGLEFLKNIRKDEYLRDSIIFVLTTSAADEDRVAAYSENIAGYIVKSDVQGEFDKVLKMLDYYWHIVRLPDL